MKNVVLVVMDGVGLNSNIKGNAFKLAKTDNLDRFFKIYPNSRLDASGLAVGLPINQMGSSEAGHITIGAGRIVPQSLQQLIEAVEDGSFYNNKEILNIFSFVKKNKSKLHICGLISDGGIHTKMLYIKEIIKMAMNSGVERIYIHAFTDGRDTATNVAIKYLDELNDIFDSRVSFATISGRYYSMDRERMWDKTEIAYNALVWGKGQKYNNYHDLIDESYSNNISDEFIKPAIIDEKGLIDDNDGIIMTNFRSDRITQLFSAISNPLFDKFKTKKLLNIKLLTMYPVDEEIICTNAFKHIEVENTLGEWLIQNHKKILRISETSKYAHVTHFFDGDKDTKLDNMDSVIIPKQNVETYDLMPKMRSIEITDYVLKNMDEYDFIFINYPNGDMLGHTGNLNAAIEGIEVMDSCIGKLEQACIKKSFTLLVVADHGNCEEMLDKDDNPLTTHTTNKVPFIVCSSDYVVSDGGLKDIAPSILKQMGMEIPKEMNGNIIIKKK